MPDDDRVLADEDVFDDQAHDSLALNDVKRVGGAAQPTEERRESLGQAQERRTIGILVSDRLRSVRSICSRCRSEGMRSRSCSSDQSSS